MVASDGIPLLKPKDVESTNEGEKKETLLDRVGSRMKTSASSIWDRKFLLLVLIAAFLNALRGLFSKLVLIDLDPILAGFVDLVTVVVCCIPANVYYRSKLTTSPKMAGVLFLTGSLRGVTTILVMVAFKNIDAGDAEAIISSRPVIVGALAWIILSERMTLLDIIAGLFALMGVVLLAKPTIIFDLTVAYNQKTLIGSLSAIGVAFMIAMTGVLRRVLSLTEIDKNVSLMYINLVGAGLCGVACAVLGEWQWPAEIENQIYLIALGVVGYGHGILTIIALSKEKTYHVFMIKSSTFLMLYVLQYIFLGVTPDLPSIVGSMGIIMSTVLVAKSKLDSDTSEGTK